MFAAFAESAAARGFGVERRPTGVALRTPKTGSRSLAMFLNSSSPEVGLNIGIDVAALDLASHELPGMEAPRAGFLNTNRFLKSTQEFTFLLDRAMAKAGKGMS